MAKKTALYFGSFNPVHIGHMAIANYLVEFSDLDELWFVVTPHNPLKERKSLLPDSHRLEMIRLAIDDDPRFKASDIEFRLPKPSYTSHTLAYITEKYPDREFVLIIGGDNLSSFHKWKNPEEILKNHEVYVYARPGFDGGSFAQHPSIKLFHAPQMEISSSFIRNAIQEGHKPDRFMPPKVAKYVAEMNFFTKH